MSRNVWPGAPELDALGLDIPIIQAPMAGAGSVALAQAVHAAGGLGSLPGATLDHNSLQEHLDTLMGRSGAPFNVNFFTHPEPHEAPTAQSRWRSALRDEYRQWKIDPTQQTAHNARASFNEAICELIERCPPAVVSFHFGLPHERLVTRVKAAGCQVWSSATTVAEAQWLEEHGADVIIAQGVEAGGHRALFLNPADGSRLRQQAIDTIAYQVGTLSLVPQIVDAVTRPVIAAGGIGDGRCVAAALALGASAVQIGTAFLFTREASITAMHRQALQHGTADQTVLTNLFSGKPARSAVNHLIQTHGPMSTDVPPFPTAAAALAPLKSAAESANRADYSSLWSGQSAQLTARLINRKHTSDEPPSATHLTQWIAEHALDVMNGRR